MTEERKKHHHYDMIHAWANGYKVERFDEDLWVDDLKPTWDVNEVYRIKPTIISVDVHLYWNGYNHILECLDPRINDHMEYPNYRVRYNENTGDLLDIQRIDNES